jgi:hypothetical protein
MTTALLEGVGKRRRGRLLNCQPAPKGTRIKKVSVNLVCTPKGGKLGRKAALAKAGYGKKKRTPYQSCASKVMKKEMKKGSSFVAASRKARATCAGKKKTGKKRGKK